MEEGVGPRLSSRAADGLVRLESPFFVVSLLEPGRWSEPVEGAGEGEDGGKMADRSGSGGGGR